MRRWILVGLFGLTGCAAPLYVCYPAPLVRERDQEKLEILVCFPHDRYELSLTAIQDEADAVEGRR